MGFVPPGAEWYVAELIEEIRVEGDDRNVVHKNLILIHARSPEAAYARALQIGEAGESTYQNPDGATVKSNFRGLGYLDVIHDGLEDGAELLYQKKVSVREEELAQWVHSKEDLTLFQKPVPRIADPDYSSRDIVDGAKKLIERG